MPLGLKSQVNGKRHNFGEANIAVSFLSNHEGKTMQREADRKLSNCSYSKRPRIDQSESYPRNSRVDDTHRVDDASTILQKNVDLIRTSSADKARVIKSKRGLDGKRIDRKNFRSGTKSRYDNFTSRTGFPGMDSTCGGHNILGMLSLKSDISDVTKHMDDLRLGELLDGSYRYSNINAEKGKKPPSTSENMFVSVKKAFLNLPQNSSADSNGSIKAAQVLIKTSSSSSMSVSSQNDKDANQLSSTAKYPSLDDTNLYTPKEVLKRLVLPPAHDLDTLLLDISLPSCKSTLPKKTCHGASLPPFSWSSSHTGVCKTTVDTGKQMSTKNTCQGRWLRIENTILAGDNRDCFSDWEQLTFDNNEDPLQKSALQDVGSSRLFLVTSSVEGNTRDNTVLEKESCSSVSHTFKRLSLMEQTNCPHIGLECDSKKGPLLRTCVSDASLNSQGKDPDFLDQVRPASQFSNPEFAKKDTLLLNKHGCSAVCCLYPSKDADREYDRSSWNSSTLEMSKPDNYLCEMHAAEILVGMTRCCSTLRTRNEDGGKAKWPKTSMQKTTKTQKLVSSMEKSGSLVFKTRHHDPVRTIGLPYWENKPSEKKNDSGYTGTAGRVPMKCSGRMESGLFPSKLEKDLPIGARSLHNVTVRSIPSLARVENGYENQQKLRKTTLATSTLGTYIKDWNRGRNKQGQL